jgi:hypothetical protein
MLEKKDKKERTISLEDELATWNIIIYKINVIFTKTDLNKVYKMNLRLVILLIINDIGCSFSDGNILSHDTIKVTSWTVEI